MSDAQPTEVPLSDVPEIEELLDQLEHLAPHVADPLGKPTVYRAVDHELLNDAVDDEDEGYFDVAADMQDWMEWQAQQQLPFIYEIDLSQLTTSPRPVAAIDSGLIRLGETEDGLIIALRGTIVTLIDGETVLNLYRTGPIYLRNQDRLQILHALGTSLNRPDIFVEVENDQPVRIKSGVADDAQKYSDRFRNWFERILQRIAVRSITNGVVIIDGALTLNTRDTPTEFLTQLATTANDRGNALIGVSKQSRLQVADRSVRFWLSEAPRTTCYRQLSSLMSSEMKQRVLGSTYAIRFSPYGPTFRVDVKPVKGQSDTEAIETLFASCLMRGGYPDVLVQAHAHSYFTSPSVAELQAQCGARYSLRAAPELELTGIFGPFGGRFK